jgi:hypothetical protein
MRNFSVMNFVFFLFWGQLQGAGFYGDPDTIITYRHYPVPRGIVGMIFYVQRSHNRNTVIYELKYRDDGTLDSREPLHASWIRFEEGGIRKELSFIQNKIFGLEIVRVAKEGWLVHFRSYKKRDIYLLKHGKDNGYEAIVKINGHVSILTSLFLGTVTNSLGIPSIIEYIDIHGIDPASNKHVMERIILNKKI